MPNTITNRQMFFLIFFAVVSPTVVDVPKVMVEYAGTGNWLPMLVMSVVFALAAFILVRLGTLFEGKMIFEYSQELIGKFGAYFIAIFFVQFFTTSIVGTCIFMSGLLKSNFLPKTPALFTSLAALPVLGFVAYKGITNVARLIEIYGVIFILISGLMHLVMIFQGDAKNILPLFNAAELPNYAAGLKSTIFPLLGFEVLLCIPMAKQNRQKGPKMAFWTMIVVGIYYVYVIETCMMMIGFHELPNYKYPIIIAIRLIELPVLKIFQRFDLLFLTAGFIGMLSGVSIMYLNVVEYLCRMLPKVKRLAIVVIVGAVIAAILVFIRDINGIQKTIEKVLTYSGLFTAFLLPLSLYLVARGKGYGKKKIP